MRRLAWELVIVFAIASIFLLIVSFSVGAPISTLCVILGIIGVLSAVQRFKPELLQALKKPDSAKKAPAQPPVNVPSRSSTKQSYMMLISLNGPERKRVTVSTSPFVVGTGSDADFRVLDQYVSRRHIVIEYDSVTNRRYLIDTSRNGTKLNGMVVKKEERVLLQHGDTLQIGDLLFCVEYVRD